MATPIQNAQFAQSLFDPMRQTVNSLMQSRLAIAQRNDQIARQTQLANLRRMQEIEDQKAKADLSTKLTNLQIAGQKDIESLRASRDDAKASADAKKRVTRAVREAFAKYQEIGGTKKIADFGALDDEATYYAIAAEAGALAKQQQGEQLTQYATMLRKREQELGQMLNPTPEDISSARDAAVSSLSLDDRFKDAAEIYSELVGSKGADVAMAAANQKQPGFASALSSAVRQQLTAARDVKAKSPEFIKSLQSYQSDRAAATKVAAESPFGMQFFSALNTPEKTTKETQVKSLGDMFGTNATPAPAAPTQEQQAIAQAQEQPSGYGGLVGATEGTGRRLSNLMDIGKLMGSTVAEVPLSTLNLIAGGDKRLQEGLDQREAYRQNLIKLYNLRNPQSQMDTTPVFAFR